MTIAKVTQHTVADAVEVHLPLALAAHLGLEEGDALVARSTPDGILLMSEAQAVRAEQLELGRAFMDEYAETFRALAK